MFILGRGQLSYNYPFSFGLPKEIPLNGPPHFAHGAESPDSVNELEL